MEHRWKILAGTHVAALIAGYQLAPREMLDTEVKQTGFFQTDTLQVLSATVNSLKSENKLAVYSYKGDARVSVSRSKFLVLEGYQELIVPANVTYFLDMADLGLEDVRFDKEAKIVTVRLSPLKMGDVAFQPEAARTINGGLLKFSQAQVDELSRLNYASARRAFIKQAQSPTLVAAAKQQAKGNIANQFEIPLRIVGQPDVRVVAEFAS